MFSWELFSSKHAYNYSLQLLLENKSLVLCVEKKLSTKLSEKANWVILPGAGSWCPLLFFYLSKMGLWQRVRSF